MHDLPLQIGQIDVIGITDCQPANAARGKIKTDRCPQAAGTNQQYVRLE